MNRLTLGSRPMLAGLVTSLVATAGCGESAAAPSVPHCSLSAATELALPAGGDTAIDLIPDPECVSFPANSSAGQVEYVVVAQAAGGIPGDAAPFTLRSVLLVTPAPPRASVP